MQDYTHRDDRNFSDFSKSKAQVMVFSSEKLVKLFNVVSGKGTNWKVFEIKKGEICQ